MKILAIETATEACSAALFLEGEVRERFEVAPRRHAEWILPMMDQLLREAGLSLRDLDAVAFGRGPGAFTGLRIAAGVAQGAALGAGLAVAPVSTLAALGREGLDETGADYALVALDARMHEVYWAVYRRDGRLLGEEQVIPPDRIRLPDEVANAVAVGPGWKVYGEILREKAGARVRFSLPQRLPRAAWVARLAARMVASGGLVPPEAAQPVYLRDQVVTVKENP
ncbi:MAG TPA: tRNA (adenosine(37)-N6)-threonylcarbamoyltransferase complex dimerization subunit type 1 TsaB [Methylothermaceae bacterium]|nr:tRNA (adenosine(37)-N6)-threonylcarbamoyltransferase complex dimerization subunit type 1 TsaB [Methylothermaceae bacterium]